MPFLGVFVLAAADLLSHSGDCPPSLPAFGMWSVSELALDPYHRWGYRTAATRLTVCVAIILCLLMSVVEECFLSEDCTSAMDSRLLAPHFQGVLSMLAATTFASMQIFTVGGGLEAIQRAARDREWQLAVISLSLVGSHLLYNNAISVMSGTGAAYAFSWHPLLMPFGALCFEREPTGEVLNYKSGVLPGLAVITLGASLAVSRHGASTTAIGLACAAGAVGCECVGYVTAAVVLRANGLRDGGTGKSGGFSAYMPVAWWGSLGAVPIMILKASLWSPGNDEGNNVRSLYREHPVTATIAFAVFSCASGLAFLLQFALIHAASPLTTAIVQVCALSLAAILGFAVAKVPTFTKQLPLNVFGLIVLCIGICLHIRYMHAWQRAKEEAQLRGGGLHGGERVCYGSLSPTTSQNEGPHSLRNAGTPAAAGPAVSGGHAGVGGCENASGSAGGSLPPSESTPLNR